MRTIRGVILDVDGTLVDSNDAHADAWMEAFADHGLRISRDRIRKLIGMGGDKLLPLAAGLAASSAEGKAIAERRQEIFKTRYLPHLKPFAGARDLLTRMRQFQITLAVATSAKKEEAGLLLDLCGATDLVSVQVCSDDVARSKPDPDLIAKTRERLAIPAEQVMVLGDTPYDIKAAQRAGIAAVALRCGGWHDRDLAGAIAIYDSPADLLANYDCSPLGATQEWEEEDSPHEVAFMGRTNAR